MSDVRTGSTPIEDRADLGRLFSFGVLGLFPETGSTRVRRTAFGVLGNAVYIAFKEPASLIREPLGISRGLPGIVAF